MLFPKPRRQAFLLLTIGILLGGLLVARIVSRSRSEIAEARESALAVTTQPAAPDAPVGTSSRPDRESGPVSVVPYREPSSEPAPNSSPLDIMGLVVDQAGQPVMAVQVELHLDPMRGEGAVRDTPALTQTTTDTGGRFALGGIVRSETYSLRVEHPDYQVTYYRPVHVIDPNSLHPTIVLETGATLTGTVRSEDGAALADATVTVFQSSDQGPPTALRLERSATTRADGTFRISHLSAGVKRIVAVKTGYAAEVAEGYRCLALPDAPPLDLVLAFETTIKGRVIDGTRGTPLANVPIGARIAGPWSPPAGATEKGEATPAGPRAVPAGTVPRIDPTVAMRMPPGPNGAPTFQFAFPDYIRNRAWFDLSTVSRADGTFEFTNVRQADYVLFVDDDSYSRGTEWCVHAGDENVTLDIAPGMALGGRVIDEETGAPITQFVVGVGTSGEPGLVPPAKRHQVDAPDGRFEVRAPRSSVAWVHVFADGFAAAVAGPFAPNGPDRADNLTIALHHGATVSGLVKGPDGVAVTGANVSIVDALPDAGGPDDGMRFMARRSFGVLAAYHAVTDGQGRYSITGVPAGRLAFHVMHPDYAETTGAPFVCSGRGPEAVPDVNVKRASSLEGQVRGLQGHAGHLLVRGIGAGAPARSLVLTPDGRFRCAGLAAGTYQLIVMRDDRADPAAFLSQTTAAPRVELREGEDRGGVVVGEEPAPVSESAKK